MFSRLVDCLIDFIESELGIKTLVMASSVQLIYLLFGFEQAVILGLILTVVLNHDNTQ